MALTLIWSQPPAGPESMHRLFDRMTSTCLSLSTPPIATSDWSNRREFAFADIAFGETYRSIDLRPQFDDPVAPAGVANYLENSLQMDRPMRALPTSTPLAGTHISPSCFAMVRHCQRRES